MVSASKLTARLEVLHDLCGLEAAGLQSHPNIPLQALCSYPGDGQSLAHRHYKWSAGFVLRVLEAFGVLKTSFYSKQVDTISFSKAFQAFLVLQFVEVLAFK